MFCLLYQEEELDETIAEECESYDPCPWALEPKDDADG